MAGVKLHEVCRYDITMYAVAGGYYLSLNRMEAYCYDITMYE